MATTAWYDSALHGLHFHCNYESVGRIIHVVIVVPPLLPQFLKKLFHSASLHQALNGSTPLLSMIGTSALQQQTTKFFGCLKKVCTFKTVAFHPSLAVLI